MPSVDEKLLAQNEDSADRAGEFRNAKRNNKNDEFNDNDNDSDASFKDSMKFIRNPNKYVEDDVQKTNRKLLRISLLKQRTQAARRKRGEQIKKEKPSKINSAKIVLANILRFCWVPGLKLSFGLTLIYINIHWFLSRVMPFLFCKLGEEWFLRPDVKYSKAKQKIAKKAGELVNPAEEGGCCCLNSCILMCLLVAFIIMIMPIAVFYNVLKLSTAIFKYVTGMF